MEITFKQQGNGIKSWIVDGQLTYDSPINTYHNKMLETYLNDLGYLHMGELALWFDDNKYGKESKDIRKWWIDTCKLVEDYLILDPNEINAAEFITTIPTLII